jgi:hypothetical protein
LIRSVVTYGCENKKLSAGDVNTLLSFEKQMLRMTCGPIQTEEGRRMRNNEELEKLMGGEVIVKHVKKNIE